jgi:hypothetical protein
LCKVCPHFSTHESAIEGVQKHYCGVPFKVDDGSCGCLLGVTVKGEFRPGGKILVGSERCPGGKW